MWYAWLLCFGGVFRWRRWVGGIRYYPYCAPQQDKLDILERFIDTATLLNIDDKVTIKTIELRRGTKKIKLGDAIIAATALVHGLILLTNNTSDFKHIDGLLVVNPHDIV